MKKVYRKVFHFFLNFPATLEIIKSFFAEWISIYRKARLYRHIRWTKEQQKEFDDFWKKNYGKKISNRWHRLYEACNGVYKVDYFPEYLYSIYLEKKINNYSYCNVFADKSLNDILFNNKIKNVRTPDFFVFNNRGIFYDFNRNIISIEKVFEILKNIGDAVIKPTRDTSSGNGVKIVNFSNGINTRTEESIKDILLNYRENFIVQEKLQPCDELKTLYPNAINTVRIISYITGDTVCTAPISLRIGGGGGEVDNIHAGGMVISVGDDGLLGKSAYRLGWGDNFEKFEKHPDTNIAFENYKLHFIPNMIDVAKALHTQAASIGIISWDFTVDSNDNIVVVEANYIGQSVWFPQMISGESFFGDNTKNILKFLRGKR